MVRKLIVFTLSLLLFLPAFSYAGESPQSRVVTMEKQSMLTPQRALELLKQGNERFVNNKPLAQDINKAMKETARYGQNPIAIILSCIDSRSIANLLFDQGLGNLFVARVAGNVTDKNIFGSMEFATDIVGVPLIVVMGHTSCGAVEGACSGTFHGNLNYLLNAIRPAVETVKKAEGKSFSCQTPASINAIAKQNVLNQLHNITKYSPEIDKLIADKKVMVVGAMQNLKTGNVIFFNKDGKKI